MLKYCVTHHICKYLRLYLVFIKLIITLNFKFTKLFLHKGLGYENGTTKSTLTLSWQRSLSYRNQSVDLESKSVDWFLYDSKLRHERVNEVLSSVYASGNNMSLILSRTYCHWKWKGRKHSAAISLMLTG